MPRTATETRGSTTVSVTVGLTDAIKEAIDLGIAHDRNQSQFMHRAIINELERLWELHLRKQEFREVSDTRPSAEDAIGRLREYIDSLGAGASVQLVVAAPSDDPSSST